MCKKRLCWSDSQLLFCFCFHTRRTFDYQCASTTEKKTKTFYDPIRWHYLIFFGQEKLIDLEKKKYILLVESLYLLFDWSSSERSTIHWNDRWWTFSFSRRLIVKKYENDQKMLNSVWWAMLIESEKEMTNRYFFLDLNWFFFRD